MRMRKVTVHVKQEFLYDDKVEEELSDDKDPHDVSTFVPGVRKSIGERQSEPTIPWPEKPHIFGLRSPQLC